MHQDIKLLLVMLLSEVLIMAGFAAWPVALLELQEYWQLSNVEAGWIGGAYFIGYVIAVPVLVGITDRIDARLVYLCSSLLTALGLIGFGLIANGFWTAAVFNGLVGAGLAGTYMPGLQMLTSRVEARNKVRLVPWYTSTFGIGTGGSYAVTSLLLGAFGWQVMFVITGIAAIAGFLVILFGTTPLVPSLAPSSRRHPLDFRPVLANPKACSYILSYGGHSYELFAFRSWSVAFLVYVSALSGAALSLEMIGIILAVFSFIGMAASVYGAGIALRMDRQQYIAIIGAISAAIALIVGFSLGLGLVVILVLVAVYNLVIMLDSAALTAGTVEAARDDERGAMLAMHSLIGFGGGALGPPAVGLALDLFGGDQSSTAWFAAFVAMGLGSFLSVVMMLGFIRLASAHSRQRP